MKQLVLTSERWRQDPHDPDLWHGPHGLIINSAALNEREPFYAVVRRIALQEGFAKARPAEVRL